MGSQRVGQDQATNTQAHHLGAQVQGPPDTQPWSPGFKGQDKDPDPELGFSVGWEGSLHEGPTRAWEKPDRRNLKRHSMLQGSASAWPSVCPLKAEGDW